MPSSRVRNNKSKHIIIPTVKLVTVNLPERVITGAGRTGLGYVMKAGTYIKKVYGQITKQRISKYITDEPIRRHFNYIGRLRPINQANHNNKRKLTWNGIVKGIKNTIAQRHDAKIYADQKREFKRVHGHTNPSTFKDGYIAKAKNKKMLRKVA